LYLFLNSTYPHLTFLHVLMQAKYFTCKAVMLKGGEVGSPGFLNPFLLLSSSKEIFLPLPINLIITLVTLWRIPNNRRTIYAPNPGRSFIQDHSGIPFHPKGGCMKLFETKGFPTLDCIWGGIPS
jgi:hypothetical protein